VAQTRKKRRRKHRGTQAGTIDRTGRTGRPRTQAEAKQISRQRRQERLDRPPTVRGAAQRAGIAAAIFGVAVVAFFHQKPASAVAIAVVMFVIYIPLGYGTDKAIYNFRQRRKARG
jgi:uncharacterized YccA/Bax inhibitor family protein